MLAHPAITDQVALHQYHYQIHKETNNLQKCEEHARQLIKLQPQNWDHYKLLLDVTSPDALKEFSSVSLIKGRILLNVEQD